MTDRERFLKIAHFELTDELFLPSNYQWFFGSTITRWIREGAPLKISSPQHRSEYFGFERAEIIPVISGEYSLGKEGEERYVPPLVPLFEAKVLEEEQKTRIVIDESGTKYRQYKDEPERMPQWLEFPVKNREGWKEYKKRLDPHSPMRFPEQWQNLVKSWENRIYPLGMRVGSFFGLLRAFTGLENLSVMYYENPKLIHEMGDWIEYFEIEIIKKVVKDVQLDFVYYWEDMAYKTGSLISPKMFREFMMPHYKKINALLRNYGIDIILVDSDGDTTELIPLWMESGINGHYPLEVTAGMDAVKLRKKYGKNLILMGNIDKRALAKGKREIKEEIMKKLPFLLSQGGYFAALDHAAPPDIPFENYVYYLKLLREVARVNRSSHA